MAFNKATCPHCGKDAIVNKSYEIQGKTVHLLKCSHIIYSAVLDKSDPSKIVSMDGKKLFPYQVAGIDFLEQADGRALLADEMGVGKTIQALGFAKLHPELGPFLYIVKSSLKTQWQKETMRWCGEDAIPQIIETSKDAFIPGMFAYILPFDLLRRFAPKVQIDHSLSIAERLKKLEETHPLVQAIKRHKIKTIIIDECQAIKNHNSERSIQVRMLCKYVKHIIALSGTPIKNRASEYFTILNILHPEMYPVYERFVFNECDTYWNGKTNKAGGLRFPDEFMRKTKRFILRRERKDVLPDLPNITRNFSFHELAKEVQAEYIETMGLFEDEFNSNSKGIQREANILKYISIMRHITGRSKIDPCVDFVMEFLGGTDRKLTIFVHHKDVSDALTKKIGELCEELELPKPLQLTSDLSTDARAKMVDDFTRGNYRIMIASTLASGEGLNLQACSDCVMLERQWNPANEEQAEGRFIRVGQQANKVTATYFVAVGTIDEFFAELVEQKREIVTKTLGGEAVKWDQSSLIKELCDKLAVMGASRWRL